MKYLKYVMPFFIGLGFVLSLVTSISVRSVYGNGSIVVTKFGDSNDGQCDADCSLREAINLANSNGPEMDVIQLQVGTYSLTLQDEGDLDVTGNLTLIGRGMDRTIIDAEQARSRAFYFHGSVATALISGVAVYRGQTGGSGGAIYQNGDDLTLINVKVSHNSATFRGGGIFAENGNVTIQHSEISQNDALSGAGGGLDFTGGGGIAIANGDLVLDHAHILTNTSNGDSSSFGGGGICICPDLPWKRAHLKQTGVSTIAYNVAQYGGGVSVTAGGQATIYEARIISNVAHAHGGGLNLLFSSAIVDEGYVVDNLAYDGGGISVFGEEAIGVNARATLNNVEIATNEAERYGGGLYAKKSQLTLTGGQILSNTAGKQAGGLYLFDGNASLTSLHLLKNMAQESGGGLLQEGTGHLSITNSCIIGNSALAILADGPVLQAQHNWWGTFDGPSGEGDGHGDTVGQNITYEPFHDLPILSCHRYWVGDLIIGQHQQFDLVTGQITYTLSYTNNGPEMAPNVLITALPSADLTYLQNQEASPALEMQQLNDKSLHWLISEMPPFESGTITLKAQLMHGQSVTNTVTITSSEIVDTGPENNQSDITFLPPPFQVLSTFPLGHTQIGPTDSISVAFTRPLNQDSINSHSYQVWGQQSGIHSGQYYIDQQAVIFTSDVPFLDGETVRLQVNQAVKAPDGLSLIPFSTQFNVTANPLSPGKFAKIAKPFGNGRNFDVALGDLNQDGRLDMFVVNGGTLDPNEGQPNEVWHNKGLMATDVFTLNQLLGDEVSTGIALGDLDNDGDLDAFVTNWLQANQIWLNQGLASGRFTLSTNPGHNLGQAASRAVALADLNGDGYLDAIVVNEGAANQIWLNQGEGQAYFVAADTFSDVAESVDVALGDLDNDGQTDALVINRAQPDEIWLGNGDGTFRPGQLLDNGNVFNRAVSLGDIDNDGDLDAVIANSFGFGEKNELWLNGANGKPLGEFIQRQPFEIADNSWAVDLGDINGDGFLDVLFGNVGENLIWLNNGNRSFRLNQGKAGDTVSYSVALGDVDGDGDLDLFSGGSFDDQANQIWLNAARWASYLPLILTEENAPSSAPPPTKTLKLIIVTINTGDNTSVEIRNPDTGQLLGNGCQNLKSNRTSLCSEFTLPLDQQSYRLQVYPIRCDIVPQTFNDAESILVIRSVVCP